MTYNILIKASNTNPEIFKFYQENGEVYSTSDLTALTTMYNSLIEKYPTSQVIPIHRLDVELNTVISETINI